MSRLEHIRSSFSLEGVGQMAPLSFLDGPDQDHCFVQLQGALFTGQSMRGPGRSFCVFVFGGVGGTRYQKVELRICVFICDNVS